MATLQKTSVENTEKVSIVIPVYNQWELVKKSVDAFLQFDRDHIREIIVVNDCSPQPNPFDFDNMPVEVLTNEHNLGYAGTVNHGLRKACSDIVILMDSDACPINSFIPEMLDFFRKEKELGCLGFSTVDEQGRKTGSSQKEPSMLGYILGQRMEARLDNLNLPFFRPRIPYTCSVAYRKACLEELDFFDDKNFPSIECDLDLNMRIRNSKWEIFETEKIVVCHSGGHSYKVNNRRVSMFHELRWKLLKKNNKIKYPHLVRRIVIIRILSEMMMMKLLIAFNVDKQNYKEKLKGRKHLIKSVNSYV